MNGVDSSPNISRCMLILGAVAPSAMTVRTVASADAGTTLHTAFTYQHEPVLLLSNANANANAVAGQSERLAHLH